jgi:response regulator of citrate/malate metabolism
MDSEVADFPWLFVQGWGDARVLNILIVEDDSQLAQTLKYLVEDNPRYRVVATAADAEGAIEAAETHVPDLVLLDLHLANATTGFSVAVRLTDMGVPCLFVSGKAPSFPMPDLALGCLMKPFTAEDVHRSLAMAEDMLRGRETFRPRLPDNLTIYESSDKAEETEAGFIESRPSLRTRFEHWISGHQAH